MYTKNIVMLGMAILCTANMQAMQKVTRIPQPHWFVLNTLLKGYPELRTTRTLVIRDGMKENGFQAGKIITEQGQECDIVDVPFTKEELTVAKQFKKDARSLHAEEIHKKLIVLGLVDLANCLFENKKNRMYQKLWESKVYTLLETHGFACRSTTLDLWQGILLHEGAHLLYNDSIAALPIEEALPQLKNIENLSNDTLVDILEQIMPAYKQSCVAEYRADQEVTKRTQNVAVLRALSMFCEDHEFWNQCNAGAQKSLSERIGALFVTHPAHFTRAQYFAQAADALEKNLHKKS